MLMSDAFHHFKDVCEYDSQAFTALEEVVAKMEGRGGYWYQVSELFWWNYQILIEASAADPQDITPKLPLLIAPGLWASPQFLGNR